MHFIECLNQKREFPSEASKFRFNTITRESYLNFKHSSNVCTKEIFNDFKSIDPSKWELDHHLNSSTLETSKKSSSTPLDDFLHQDTKLDELNLSLFSSSDLNYLFFDSNSSCSDSEYFSDRHLKDLSSFVPKEDSSLDEKKEEACEPSISASNSP